MLDRFILSTFACFGLSTAAFAGCHCNVSGGYDLSVENGVNVMRGDIPSTQNPQRAVIAARKSAEARALDAQRRARRAERDLAQSRAVPPSYSQSHSDMGYSRRGYIPAYNSGRYGYGAAISAPRLVRGRRGIRGVGARGRGFKGGARRGLSRPVFSTHIRG